MERLTLADVWELAPDGSPAPERDGVRKSPFRDDAHPSFSISDNLTAWKDFATGEKRQGVWNFVQASRPEWSKSQIAKYLIAAAGLEDQKRERKRSSSAATLRKEKAEQRRELEEKIRRQRRERLQVTEGPALMAWPECVEHHWAKGEPSQSQMTNLAERRGWPVEWVHALVDANQLRWPTLPWNSKRFPAFIVALWSEKRLAPHGYHQRIWTSDGGPDWLFVPYRPKQATTPLLKAIDAWTNGTAGSVVTPLPFVVGNPSTAKLWIIAEGQWDAVTLYGAIGGFEDAFEMPICVFGIRGAGSGIQAFFAYYAALIRKTRPQFWLFPDNDPASYEWEYRYHAAGARERAERAGKYLKVSELPMPTFTERLRALVGEATKIPVTRIPRSIGKDFNDYWKAKRPTRDQILRQVEALGVL